MILHVIVITAFAQKLTMVTSPRGQYTNNIYVMGPKEKVNQKKNVTTVYNSELSIFNIFVRIS